MVKTNISAYRKSHLVLVSLHTEPTDALVHTYYLT